MTLARHTEFEILEATALALEERGYDVIRKPSTTFLPEPLRSFSPDAIAIGREPKLIIEVAQQTAQDSDRVARLQQALKSAPEWELHLVVGFTMATPDLAPIEMADIVTTLERASRLAAEESQAALLVAWATLEAIGRSRMPDQFMRPQSPATIIERMASEGMVTPSDAAFMRDMATKRNAYVHGNLGQTIERQDVERFLEMIKRLVMVEAR